MDIAVLERSSVVYEKAWTKTVKPEKKKRFQETVAECDSRNASRFFETSENNQEKEDIEITPIVKSLCGVIELPDNFDYKTEYGNYLLQKYK